jgi:hypothetical protein
MNIPETLILKYVLHNIIQFEMLWQHRIFAIRDAGNLLRSGNLSKQLRYSSTTPITACTQWERPRQHVAFTRRIERVRIPGGPAWQFSFSYQINIEYVDMRIEVDMNARTVGGHLQALREIPSQYWLPEGHNDLRARWNAMTEDEQSALTPTWAREIPEGKRWLTWRW